MEEELKKMMEEELKKRQEELEDALWKAYIILDELYIPLQIKSIKEKIDGELNGNWSDRAVEAIIDVYKKRIEVLKWDH